VPLFSTKLILSITNRNRPQPWQSSPFLFQAIFALLARNYAIAAPSPIPEEGAFQIASKPPPYGLIYGTAYV
jgi:hypothetical protein